MRLRSATVLALAGIFACEPSKACFVRAPINLEDVKRADIVVEGRIVNYKIVRNDAAQKRALSYNFLPKEFKDKYLTRESGSIQDYAKFDLLVDDVLVGSTSKKITVTWDNSTYGEPEQMGPGSFLIALRRAGSHTLPVRGASATIFRDPRPDLLTVLQAPCAGPFMFERGTASERMIRQILRGASKRNH